MFHRLKKLSMAAAFLLGLTGSVLAIGPDFRRANPAVELYWEDTGTTTVTVTGAQERLSRALKMPEEVFNAASVTLRLVGAGPNLAVHVQALSPIPGAGGAPEWTELGFTSQLLEAATSAGDYVIAISLPLAPGFRIRLVGDASGAATTVSGVVLWQ